MPTARIVHGNGQRGCCITRVAVAHAISQRKAPSIPSLLLLGVSCTGHRHWSPPFSHPCARFISAAAACERTRRHRSWSRVGSPQAGCEVQPARTRRTVHPRLGARCSWRARGEHRTHTQHLTAASALPGAVHRIASAPASLRFSSMAWSLARSPEWLMAEQGLIFVASRRSGSASPSARPDRYVRGTVSLRRRTGGVWGLGCPSGGKFTYRTARAHVACGHARRAPIIKVSFWRRKLRIYLLCETVT